MPAQDADKRKEGGNDGDEKKRDGNDGDADEKKKGGNIIIIMLAVGFALRATPRLRGWMGCVNAGS